MSGNPSSGLGSGGVDAYSTAGELMTLLIINK